MNVKFSKITIKNRRKVYDNKTPPKIMEWKQSISKFDPVFSDHIGTNTFFKAPVSFKSKKWFNEIKKWPLHKLWITEEIII